MAKLSSIRAAVALGAVAALGILPVGFLVLRAVAPVASGAADAAALLPDARALSLLARSFAIAGGATAVSVALGLALGLPLARVRLPARPLVLAALISGLAVSPYQLALGWLGGDLGTPVARVLLGHPAAVAGVLGAAHAPLVALVFLFAARQLPAGWEEAALLAAPPRHVLARIVVSRTLPALAVAALLAFLLAFSDHAVASLLQVLTYPVEIFLLHSAAFAPTQAAAACLPLVAVGGIAAVALALLVPRVLPASAPPRAAGPWVLPPRHRRLGAALVASGVLVCLVLPMAGLLRSLPSPGASLAALESGALAGLRSLLVAALAALLAGILGLAATGALVRAGRAARSALALVLLLPFAVPDSAYAIAWTELRSAAVGPFGTALAGPLLPALCLAGRWAGPVALLLTAARLSIPRSSLDAARLCEDSPLRRFAAIELPWIAPLLAGILVAVVALSMNAVGVLILTVPPGFEVLPLRIDNLVHYGARGEAAALALAGGALTAAPPLAWLLALARMRRSRA